MFYGPEQTQADETVWHRTCEESVFGLLEKSNFCALSSMQGVYGKENKTPCYTISQVFAVFTAYI